MFYYLSIGSNIEPQKNIGKCIEILLENFGSLYLYSPVYTKPEGLNTDSIFINTLVVLESDANAVFFKDILNGIERKLGRVKKNKNLMGHTCDIDIISNRDDFNLSIFSNLREGYLQSVIRSENLAKNVRIYNLECIDRPSTVYLDGSSSNKAIFGNKFDTL